MAKMYISELKNIRLRLEEYEQRVVKRIQSLASSRTDKDARQDSALRIAEQEVSPKSSADAGCVVNAFRVHWMARVWNLRNKAIDSRQSFSGLLLAVCKCLLPVEKCDFSSVCIAEC